MGMKCDQHEMGQTWNGSLWHELGQTDMKWDQHEMGRAWNGTLGHEMGLTWNGTDMKWPDMIWPTWFGPTWNGRAWNGIYPRLLPLIMLESQFFFAWNCFFCQLTIDYTQCLVPRQRYVTLDLVCVPYTRECFRPPASPPPSNNARSAVYFLNIIS